MVALARLPVHMTVTEFLEWESGDGICYELVDGQPRAMAPAGLVHGYLQSELARLIGNHLRSRGNNCKVITAPGVVPRVMSIHNVRIPDLAVTCAPVRTASIIPDPVLIVEILSPGNRAETWTNVWTYTSIPSVQEILVLHTNKIRAEILRRTGDGTWPEETAELRDGDLLLASIDFRVALAELYADAQLGG